jgi:5'-nucleotidase
MALDLSQLLVVGISSRALFNLEYENKIFKDKGLEEYTKYQLDNIDKLPHPGTGFRLIKNMLSLNKDSPERKIEVIIMSKNNAATSLRITRAMESYKLDITRSAWTGGASLANYLGAYKVDLFLSADHSDVQEAINEGFAAATIYTPPKKIHEKNPDKDIIKIAFDGDAVLFSEESEKIYKEKGLDVFLSHEQSNASKPLPDGPFASLLRAISKIQVEFDSQNPPIRTALITARNSLAHERVIRTLYTWKVRIDEVHFLGGISKHEILKAFGANIFFDDQDVHCQPASEVVPTAIVPHRR